MGNTLTLKEYTVGTGWVPVPCCSCGGPSNYMVKYYDVMHIMSGYPVTCDECD